MSGITGCYNLDGTPVDRRLLRRMADRLTHRGPDGSGQWVDGAIGMVHMMLHTTPESLRERQPLHDESGALCLTLDGRVDNREELRVALEAAGARLRTDTDAELILRAYKCWGERSLTRIIGDFAFVVWDRRRRRLFCARDILGLKPFYYYYSAGRTFLWTSELRALFENQDIPREPNEGMIGEYLSSAITNGEGTLFRNVLRLLPAHYLLVEPGRLRKERYWAPDPARQIRYRADDEYAQHFSSIFREAVRCRLRSHRPIAADLSGGLDSSSVVGMAQSLYREGAVPDPGFETYSLIFPGLSCDERDYIRDVVRRWSLTSNERAPHEPGLSYYYETAKLTQDFPGFPNDAMFDSLKALAREKGCRVCLTGLGGDDWLEGSPYHCADLLRAGRLTSLAQRFSADSQAKGSGSALHSLLRYGCWPLLPLAFRRLIRRLTGHDAVPPWIEPAFARRVKLSARLQQEWAWPARTSYAQHDLVSMGFCGWQTHGYDIGERAAARFGLEERHPMNDRRIVEFALAIPYEQRHRPQWTRYVLRQAMGQLLPQHVRERRTKADFSHSFAKILMTIGERGFFDSLRSEALERIQGPRVRLMYRDMAQQFAQGDQRYIHLVWPLWMVVGIELWMDGAFFGGGKTDGAEHAGENREAGAHKEALCSA